MRYFIGTLILSLCMHTSAFALEDFNSALTPEALREVSGMFGATSASNISILNASVESNVIHFAPSSTSIGGNTVENVMNGSTGVMGIVQNNGAASNVLQAVNVSIGELHLTSQAPL